MRDRDACEGIRGLIRFPEAGPWAHDWQRRMTDMTRFFEILVTAICGVGLGVLGLFVGTKLSRFRQHRKSEEIQTVFTKDRLD